MNEELERLFAEARASGPMGAAERRAQAISFVYGQLMGCAPEVTKDQIAREYDRMHSNAE